MCCVGLVTCDLPDDARLHRRSKRYLQSTTLYGVTTTVVLQQYSTPMVYGVLPNAGSLWKHLIAQIDLDARASTPHTELDVRYTE